MKRAKIKNMLKKLLVSFMAAMILLTSIAPSVANAQWYNQSYEEFHEMVFSEATPPQEIFGERYTYAQVQWIMYSLADFFANVATNQTPEIVSCGLVMARGGEGGGPGAEECVQAAQAIATQNTASNLANAPDGSFITFMAKDRSLSAITTMKNSMKKLNPASEVKAQTGFGYDTALNDMIRDLWMYARNISYALFIFLAIILSFMIMFRVKLNPQTVVSIQSAIPKLFITLILITFSYAIAGFVVDLMYVVIGLFALMLGPVLNLENIDLFNIMTRGLANTGVWGFAILNIFGMSVAFILALGMLLGTVFQIVNAISLFSIGTVLFIIAIIIIFLILLIITFKILISLLRAYVEFILNVFTGPLQIAIGVVVPGAGFGAWLKRVIASLAVFPIAGMLFTLSYMFLVLSLQNSGSVGTTLVDFLGYDLANVSGTLNVGEGWPPLISPGGDFLGTITPMALFMLSFTFYSMIPKISDMIKGFMSGRGFSAGSAIGEAFAAGGLTGMAYGAARDEVGSQAGMVGAGWAHSTRGGALGRVQRTVGDSARGWAARRKLIEEGAGLHSSGYRKT